MSAFYSSINEELSTVTTGCMLTHCCCTITYNIFEKIPLTLIRNMNALIFALQTASEKRQA